MAANSASLVILKIGDGATPTETFTTLGGLQTISMSHRNRMIESSHAGSGMWRVLLSDAGISAISITGHGVFTDTASEERLRRHAMSSQVTNYELHFGNGDVLRGAFLVSDYQRLAPSGEVQAYALTLQSAGMVNFVAA